MNEARGESPPSPDDRLNQLLVAATLLVVAVIVAWPKDKPPPPSVVAAYKFGQDIWNRRGWWLN